MARRIASRSGAARADYVEAIGALSWFIRHRTVPQGDARPNQLVAEASDAPLALWPEAAAAAEAPQLVARLAELEASP